MASSGGITGSVVVAGVALPEEAITYCALTLAEYARLISYDECAFFGVSYDGQTQFDCRTLWTEAQRLAVWRALQQAQEMMEEELGYPLCPKWIAGQPTAYGDSRYVDTQEYRIHQTTRWGHVIAGGVRATATIEADALVNLAVEPATVGPITCTISNVAEVKIYHPVSGAEITPSSLTYAGGALTIYIPRCRLTETPNTTDEGVAYTDTAAFLDSVDVVRVYNDPSTNAVIVSPHTCDGACTQNGCAEYTQTACIYISDHRLGLVDVVPATYSSGWTRGGACLCSGEIVRLNYQAGLWSLDYTLKMALVRLAHSLMPEEPCQCTVTQRQWETDRKRPDVLTAERLNCPFGASEGAWFAYNALRPRRIVRMGGF